MKRRDGDARNSEGGPPEYMKKKKKRLGGKGLSLEAFVGAKSKPVVTASQIRKQREVYQNAKKVNKYRKTLKHLVEEGHEFRPLVPLSIDAEISGQDLSEPGNKDHKEQPSSSAGETEPHSTEAERDVGKKDQIRGRGKKLGKGSKPLSYLERLREEYEKKRQEEEEIRREKQELFAEQQAAREKSKKERKEVQKKFRKSTGKGQPVMKHRMEHLLDSIQRGMKS